MTACNRQRAAARISDLARRGLDVSAFCRECNEVPATAVRVLRAQAGRIAEENRRRSPVTGSVRLSLTRGRVMLCAYA